MIDVFLSRPTWLPDEFTNGLTRFLSFLKTHDLKPHTIGATDYPNQGPLDEVIALIDRCRGAIILGYPQIVIAEGRIKDLPIQGEVLLPTEWNHIEAGLAYARSLPLLVIHHIGVIRGIFDRGAINNFIYEVDLRASDWPLTPQISGALTKWKTDVLARPIDPPTSRSDESSGSPLVLEGEVLEILKFFGDASKRFWKAPELASHFGINVPKMEYYLGILTEAGYLHPHHNYIEGTSWSLIQKGRTYLVENGHL